MRFEFSPYFCTSTKYHSSYLFQQSYSRNTKIALISLFICDFKELELRRNNIISHHHFPGWNWGRHGLASESSSTMLLPSLKEAIYSSNSGFVGYVESVLAMLFSSCFFSLQILVALLYCFLSYETGVKKLRTAPLSSSPKFLIYSNLAVVFSRLPSISLILLTFQSAGTSCLLLVVFIFASDLLFLNFFS